MRNFIMTMLAVIALVGINAHAMASETVKIAWTHYTGWEPVGYMLDSGILAKWNEKYGTDVQIVFVGDYVDSIMLYSSGQYQGVSVTNMDVLAIAGVGGRHSTALIVGDYSNGNDGLILKGYASLKDVDTNINLVEYSVSHYLLARCAEKAGVNIDDLTLENTMDADIPAVVEAMDNIAAVSWNPMLMTIRNLEGVNVVCTSAEIPGEIIDMIVVGDEVDENSRKALVGAWYETMALMKAGDADALAFMAEQAGSSVSDFEAQLETTAMFYDAADAVAFVQDGALKTTMDEVVNFSFKAGVYDGVDDPKELGVKFPDGSVMGDAGNVMLTFDPSVTKMAADGGL